VQFALLFPPHYRVRVLYVICITFGKLTHCLVVLAIHHVLSPQQSGPEMEQSRSVGQKESFSLRLRRHRTLLLDCHSILYKPIFFSGANEFTIRIIRLKSQNASKQT